MGGNDTESRPIRVVAPARLHIGFFDLNGGLGRRFGSLGLALDQPAVRLQLRQSASMSVRGDAGVSSAEIDRARRYLDDAAVFYGTDRTYALEIAEVLPAHAGFGSGTQLSLSIAAAVARLEGHVFDAASLSMALDRGARSGIGIAAFEHGGFVVDGGKGMLDRAPPILSRLPFPEAWRLLLVMDERADGVHGAAEKAAFKTLPIFPEADAAALCRLVLVGMLPALAEEDLATFGSALTQIQQRLGDHFAPAQGGGRFTSPRVGAAIEEALRLGGAGGGQSSWGPTGFALFPDQARADAACDRLALNYRNETGLKFIVAAGRNQGAQVSG